MAEAVIRIGRKALKSLALWLIAGVSFISIFFFGVSFVLIILTAALTGWAGFKWSPRQFPASKDSSAASEPDGSGYLQLPPCPGGSWHRSLVIAGTCLMVWWVPIMVLGICLGWSSTAFSQGAFFSKAALVTFGGAYAVLPYVAQQAVEHYGWLSHAQMMSGLALAETTPGPLIMVLQFVGFAGGWQNPGNLSPLMAATAGAAVTTWATFVPCFMFVFLGAPHVEGLRNHPRAGAALMAVTAAVVGVILNLAVSFSIHALLPESGSRFDWFIALLALAAFSAIQWLKISLIPIIGICAALGLLWHLLPR